MRILVVSDTLGDLRTLLQIVKSQPTAEIIIHCGDGNEEAQYIKDSYRDKMVVAVKGNCDWMCDAPSKEIIKVLGKKIFITHGHLYNAKFGLYNMVCAAREEEADVLLFGHTHNAMTEYDDGLYMMNPGTCRGYGASYGYIDITEKGEIFTNIVPIKIGID
jgi:putative phosphoesterase